MRPHLDRLLALSRGQRGLLVDLGLPLRDQTSVPGSFDGPRWVRVPGGSFAMGSTDGEQDEQPVHPVQVGAFAMSTYPVTNAAYWPYVAETGAPAPRHWTNGQIPDGKETHPVVNVSWHDAEAFCSWLSTKLDREVRLPTEAQWEYAAGGREGRLYPWGDQDPNAEHAHFGGSAETTAVDAHPQGATPDGICDLAGNAWEWCRDRYGQYRDEAQTDPTGPQAGRARVLRGGAFLYMPRDLRCASRFYVEPDNSDGDVGFRCVVDAPEGQGK